jgi:hypothetical protein
MHVYQIDTSDPATEGLFETAVYRFIELNASAADDDLVAMHTELAGAARCKTVRLWSADAVKRFERFWCDFRRERALCAPF